MAPLWFPVNSAKFGSNFTKISMNLEKIGVNSWLPYKNVITNDFEFVIKRTNLIDVLDRSSVALCIETSYAHAFFANGKQVGSGLQQEMVIRRGENNV